MSRSDMVRFDELKRALALALALALANERRELPALCLGEQRS